MTNLQNDRQDVLRLKELLFREERRALSHIERVVFEHDQRIGDDEALQHSVAEILAEALREADIKNHRELAASISPVVVAGIRREIINSRDEMVDALYPILGRLAAAYVASVFREFMEETNKRLEGSLSGRYLRLRLKSLFTGKSYQQLALQEAQCARVDELLLVRKGAGVLLDHWSADPDRQHGPDDYLLSSLLSAINDFAAEAFAKENHELRSLDIGDGRVYLRSSPCHLLAVKSTGQASRRFEKSLDRSLLGSLERHEEALARVEAGGRTRQLKGMLPELAEELNLALAQEKRPPVLAIALFSALALMGSVWLAWRVEDAYLTARLREKVTAALSAQADLRGFPIDVKVAPDRSRVALTGLTSSQASGEAAVAAVAEAVRPAVVEANFASVPTNRRLEAVETEFKTFAGGVDRRMDGLASREDMAAEAERLALLANSVAGAATNEQVGKITAELGVRLDGLAARLNDPDLQLRLWIQSHAVFFADDVTFRDPDKTAALLKQLAVLLIPAKEKLRVIGYTDPTGTREGNDALAMQRAEKVLRELVTLGAPRDRLKVLGRPKGAMLSFDKGPNSSNRRVEFELAYGEEPVDPLGEPLRTNAARTESHAPR
jgi:outer membrane protein OmpA-like peptidoglycan-associated protein